MMKTVRMTLLDLVSGVKFNREIDATNAYENRDICWELGDQQSQRERLEQWILDRGNEQHDTELELVGWEFITY